jgi:hypothetical protein
LVRWNRRTVAVAATGIVAAAALTVSLMLALTGGSSPRPAQPTRLLSPFTGEPIAASGPVLAVR